MDRRKVAGVGGDGIPTTCCCCNSSSSSARDREKETAALAGQVCCGTALAFTVTNYAVMLSGGGDLSCRKLTVIFGAGGDTHQTPVSGNEVVGRLQAARRNGRKTGGSGRNERLSLTGDTQTAVAGMPGEACTYIQNRQMDTCIWCTVVSCTHMP